MREWRENSRSTNSKNTEAKKLKFSSQINEERVAIIDEDGKGKNTVVKYLMQEFENTNIEE